MSAPTKALRKAYIYIKPGTEERLVYSTLVAAQRACTAIGGQVEEWHAYDGSDRMQLRCVWTRRSRGLSSSQNAFEARWIQHGG